MSALKCITKNCRNWADQGRFVGDLCTPCHAFITTGNGRYSQVYRNAVDNNTEIVDYEDLRFNPTVNPPAIYRIDSAKNNVYMLLMFEKQKEGGYDITFVGKRPLEYHSPAALWKLMKYGQTILEAKESLKDIF